MSDLLKIARAVDGDDLFVMRIRIACELAGRECDRATVLHVAKTVVADIECDEAGTINTNGADDEKIIAAIKELSDATN